MSEQIENYYKKIYSLEKPSEHEWTAGTAGPELVNMIYKKQIKPKSKILEIGCGLGTESIFLALRGMNVTAIDISDSAIKTAKQLADIYKVNVNWKVGNILNSSFEEDKFDVITDQGCFHHLTDDERRIYLHQVQKILKPDGMFILRCFSDKIPGGPQPRRISSNELIHTFYPEFRLEHLERVLSFSTTKREFPLGWFTIWFNQK